MFGRCTVSLQKAREGSWFGYSALVLVMITTTSRACATVGHDVGPNTSVVAAEAVCAFSGLVLGVANLTQARQGHRSLAWGLVGLGAGVGSVALSVTKKAEMAGFDVVAGAIAILGSSLRIRPNVNVTLESSRSVMMSLRF